MHPRSKANYGIDAPGIVRNLAIGAAASFLLGRSLYRVLSPKRSSLAAALLTIGFSNGVLCLLAATAMELSSKVGKLRVRERLLDSIPWQGDEAVLDVGCGRGLLLIGAATRLTSGRAVGVDIWRTEDQSGNTPEATLRNARAEGVEERVDIRDGDARALPFGEETFDVVLSSLALHNIPGQTRRTEALKEMVRVLKPGGRLAIVDIARTGEYEKVLREAGMGEVVRSGAHFWIFPGVRVVRGRKPGLAG